eukprot:470550-Hanusia_phi.AAC.10
MGSGIYQVMYVPKTSGSYQLSAFYGSMRSLFTFYVYPGAVDALTCYAQGVSLSVATAGFSASFTIQSKDAFLNDRIVGDDMLVSRLVYHDDRNNANVSFNLRSHYIGQGPSTNLGRYVTSYRASRSGKYQIDVRIAKQNGLNTTYYSDDNLTMPTFSSIDSNIDYDWGNESPYQNGFSDIFSVGWTGFLRARYQEVHTFQIQLPNPLERVKLWVDNEWIIDQWSSLQSIAPSGTLFMSSQLLVDVEMQYRASTGQSKVQLWWNSLSQVDEIVPSSSFFSSADPIRGSPFGLSIFPALSCGATSIARGDGLSLATAGYPATFQITARDHLSNLKTTSSDQFVVRVRHNQNFTMRDIHGTVEADLVSPGSYNVYYTPTWKRDSRSYFEADGNKPYHDIMVEMALQGAIMATYYSNQDFTSPNQTTLQESLAQDYDLQTSLQVASANGFSARYLGFLLPPGVQRYTFAAQLPNQNDRVRIWMENSLVIDQWASLSATQPSGTLSVFSEDLHSVLIEYKHEAGTSAGMGLTWEYQLQVQPIPSSRLFHGHEIALRTAAGQGLAATYYDNYTMSPLLSPIDVVLDWSGDATDRPYPTSLMETNFAARWAGFVKPSRSDEYTFFVAIGGCASVDVCKNLTSERVKLWIDDVLIVDQWSSLDSMEPLGTYMFPDREELYNLQMEYKVEQAYQERKGFSLKWENLAGRYPLMRKDGQTDSGQVAKSVVSSDRLFQTMTTGTVNRDDYMIWDTSFYDASYKFEENFRSPSYGEWDKLAGCPGMSQKDSWKQFLCRGRGISDNQMAQVVVRPGDESASQSSCSGNSLTVSTAGILRTFSLTARDSYGNERDAVDDSFTAKATLYDENSKSLVRVFSTFYNELENGLSPLIKPRPHVLPLPGQYIGSYVATISGMYSMAVDSLQSSSHGLSAVIFTSKTMDGIANQQYSRLDDEINFDWGFQGPAADLSQSSFVVIRWNGFLWYPWKEETVFYVSSDGPVKLWIDAKLILETPGGINQSSPSLSLKPQVYYDLHLEYRSNSTPSYLRLSWGVAGVMDEKVITSEYLFSGSRLIHGGRSSLAVHPAPACSTSSTFLLPLTIATAGVAASFTVISRDEYGNVRDDGYDYMLASVIPANLSLPKSRMQTSLLNANGSVGAFDSFGVFKFAPENSLGQVDAFGFIAGNQHRFSYVATTAGSNQIMAELLWQEGIPGQVSSITIIGGGGGYLNSSQGNGMLPLLVQCMYPCQGTGLNGTCTISNGVVVQVNISNAGGGYLVNQPPLCLCGEQVPTPATLRVSVYSASYKDLEGPGLMATYYSNIDFNQPKVSLDHDLPVLDGAKLQMFGPISSAVWTGIIRQPTEDKVFAIDFLSMSERAKLWIDDKLLVDEWTSLSSPRIQQQVTSSLIGAEVREFLNFRVEFECLATSSM